MGCERETIVFSKRLPYVISSLGAFASLHLTLTTSGDPWREATVSAEGLNKANTSMQPIYMSDGFHTTDLIMASGKIDQSVAAVQRAGLEYMKFWVSQWPNW